MQIDQDGQKDASCDMGTQEPADVPIRSPPTEAQLKLVRLAWKWLLSTGEVSIGPEGEWNDLTFDEIISIPEDVGEAVAPLRDEKSQLATPHTVCKEEV